VSSLPFPSSSAGPSRALEFFLFTPRPAAMGLNLFFFPSLSLFPGIDSDVECLGTSTRIYCLHCFLCMTLYAVSMLKKKKKEKKKNTQQNQSTCFGQKKKKIEVVFSVSNSELCCRLSVLFGLCVAVFCQHEILSPLEDFRGGRATAPGIWRRLWFP